MDQPHLHVIDLGQIALTVAPGEPDNPTLAKRFILSWWEKNPPERYGKPVVRALKGWCLVARHLGVEGRLLAFREPNSPQLLMAMFGERDYRYVHEEQGQ